MTVFDYHVFGLKVRSDLYLPELPSGDGGEPHDVLIVRCTIPDEEAGPGYRQSESGTLLTVEKVGRYLIREGREIVVEPSPQASERNLRLFLLGSAFGALLHQRGLLPLHANAIELGGCAFAFCGHSGAGKSTLAAWFHDRGYALLTDDVCVIGFDETGRPVAYPGIPRLRLWGEALEASGRAPEGYERSFDDRDKFDVPALDRAQLEPRPLCGIYLLRRAPDDAEPAQIERLYGVAAVETLVANTYRGGYLGTIGRTGEHLGACLQVARAVPVFKAQRRWGFDRLEEEAGRLEAHAAKIASETCASPHAAGRGLPPPSS